MLFPFDQWTSNNQFVCQNIFVFKRRKHIENNVFASRHVKNRSKGLMKTHFMTTDQFYEV